MSISMAMTATPAAEVQRLSDDTGSFYSAIAPHLDKMRRVAARLAGVDDRDEVVQDALLQAWRARQQFNPGRGTLSCWLMSITAHQATKIRRRVRPVPLWTPPTAPSTDDAIDVRVAVTRLARREKLAVDCFYFADLSVAETAAVMGCSEGTVKSTLSSAREHLRRVMR